MTGWDVVCLPISFFYAVFFIMFYVYILFWLKSHGYSDRLGRGWSEGVSSLSSTRRPPPVNILTWTQHQIHDSGSSKQTKVKPDGDVYN
jgi:hypothetical protein